MKRYLMLIAVGGMLFSACKSTGSLSGTDDVYANPAEERALAQKGREEQARKEAAEKEREAALAGARAEQVEQEKNNPYYKDPVYGADDYYDYEYASRLNRFSSPLPGAGYYDPYYTNMYTYNQNPAFWGTSIYSGGFGMPSSQFNYYSMGISSGWGYSPGLSMGMGFGSGYASCYNSYSYGMYNPYYNPYCYSAGFYDPWASNAYFNGYNAGFYNGYNNAQWGYYNRLDPNSAYQAVNIGPRGSSSGGNAGPRSGSSRATEGASVQRRQYIESVAAEQNNTPRFSEDRRSSGTRVNNTEVGRPSGNEQGRIIQNERTSGSAPSNNNGGRRANSQRVYETNPQQNTTPRQQENTAPRQHEQQRTQNNNNSPAPSNSGSGRSSNSGGGSSPRGSGSGGNTQPRR